MLEHELDAVDAELTRLAARRDEAYERGRALLHQKRYPSVTVMLIGMPVVFLLLAWSADGRHLFYMRHDEQMRPFQVWRHRLGTDHATDVLVHEELDERFFLGVGATRSLEWIVIESSSKTSGEAWLIPAVEPEWCATSVLTTRWMPGQSFDAFLAAMEAAGK